MFKKLREIFFPNKANNVNTPKQMKWWEVDVPRQENLRPAQASVSRQMNRMPVRSTSKPTATLKAKDQNPSSRNNRLSNDTSEGMGVTDLLLLDVITSPFESSTASTPNTPTTAVPETRSFPSFTSGGGGVFSGGGASGNWEENDGGGDGGGGGEDIHYTDVIRNDLENRAGRRIRRHASFDLT